MPLVQPVVLVTRPQPQADQWVERLRQRGLLARALPLLRIAAPADATPIARTWTALWAQRLVMFVSPNAVDAFFAHRPPAVQWPAGTLAGATGPGTANALQRAGVPTDRIVQPDEASEQFDSATLWQQKLAPMAWQNECVIIVRGDGGRDQLADTLRDHGASVGFVQAYRRVGPDWSANERDLFDAAQSDPAAYCWLFSSSQAIEYLRAQAPGIDVSSWRALTTHPRIAATARGAGFGQVSVATPTLDAIVAAIIHILQSPRS
jgi:uroporphyrinogen-III synthase